MTAKMKAWAKANGFEFKRGRGWVREDGGFLRNVAQYAGDPPDWKHHTKGCGYHPTIQPPR